MRKNKRIGILGGTFNPLHNGHIDLGLRVLEHFRLNSVRYILSANPPHKDGNRIVPAELRWKMLQQGLTDHPELMPDDIEINRKDYSWTIDTVRELIARSPDSSFYFISGSEGFLKITTWKEYKALFNLIRFIVVLRDKDHEDQVRSLLESEGITPGAGDEPDVGVPSVRFYSYRSEFLGISSTMIRHMCYEGKNIDGLVNYKVKEIIEENNLYGKNQP